jgi:hypothetical protein
MRQSEGGWKATDQDRTGVTSANRMMMHLLMMMLAVVVVVADIHRQRRVHVATTRCCG